jgi:hypothetical protein
VVVEILRLEFCGDLRCAAWGMHYLVVKHITYINKEIKNLIIRYSIFKFSGPYLDEISRFKNGEFVSKTECIE